MGRVRAGGITPYISGGKGQGSLGWTLNAPVTAVSTRTGEMQREAPFSAHESIWVCVPFVMVMEGGK